MGRSNTTTTRRWKQWKPEHARAVLADWRASGLPLGTFAGQRGVRPERLTWWQERLGEWDAPSPGAGEARLVPAVVTSARVMPMAAQGPVVTVRLPGAVSLEVADPEAVSPAWVAAVAWQLSRAG